MESKRIRVHGPIMSHQHFFEVKCLYNLNHCKLCMPEWVGLGWVVGLAWLGWFGGFCALASEELKQRLMNKRKSSYALLLFCSRCCMTILGNQSNGNLSCGCSIMFHPIICAYWWLAMVGLTFHSSKVYKIYI